MHQVRDNKTCIQNQRRERIRQTNPCSQTTARRTHPQSKKDTTGYSLQDPKELRRSHPLDANPPTYSQQTKTMGMHHQMQTRKENKPQQTPSTPESNKNMEPGNHLPPGSARLTDGRQSRTLGIHKRHGQTEKGIPGGTRQGHC